MIDIGWEISQQDLFSGSVRGLIIAALAAGFVLIYRSTGVLNFAYAEIGSFGVALMAMLTFRYDVPYWLAFFLAIGAAAGFAMVTELVVVRRLFNSPRLVLFIATLGVAQLAIFASIQLPDVSRPGPFPLPPKLTVQEYRWKVTDDLQIGGRELLVVIVVPLVIAALALFLGRTRFGLAIRASAENADTGRLFGISVRRVSTMVWTIGGALAGVTLILLAPLRGFSAADVSTASLGPGLLLRVLLVALIARMRSLWVTLFAGIGVGIFQRLFQGNVDREIREAVDVIFFIAILVITVMFARRGTEDEGEWSLSPKVKAIPERLRGLWYVRNLSRFGFVALFGALVLLGLFLTKNSNLYTWTRILGFALIALSVSMLTGWAGQLSLGQFAFAGVGGLTVVALTENGDIPIPFDWWDWSFDLPWGVAMVIAVAAGMVTAFIIGVPALRVKGLMLAVTTLAFAIAAMSWIFVQDVFTQGATNTPKVIPPVWGPFDFTASRKSFFFLVLVLLALAVWMVAHLRKTGIGRMMIAVRDNEDMAAASTVSGSRIKLISFTLAGGLAALGGGLIITGEPTINPQVLFNSNESINVIAIAIIGGLGSIAGPLLGVLWVKGIPAIFGASDEVRLLTSGVGLLLLLMYFPGGFMQLLYKLRDFLLGLADERMAARDAAMPVPALDKPVPITSERTVSVEEGQPWLAVRNVHVHFGGKVAVDEVSIDVYQGELVGLIGSNGAGKSTLMNAVSGFVPFKGQVEVLGRDISRLPSYRRHRGGLGRGFQHAKIYPDLTVREALMVAMEARDRSLLVPSLLGVPPSPGQERRKRADVDSLMDFVGLGRYADHFISNLSTGTRRIVELASLLAVDAKVLLLDEPTGGVAQRESEAFGPLIRRIQAELGAAVVVIEHDMPLVMSISDRVYCLEAGRVISGGSPEEVRNDPLVIASYLGTDVRAIERSGERTT
ncbi:ABC transporter permease subunit [Candidatus Poriferisocius sp.]|uniref:ABC transporter permease subunit n=1 Tax=Candidatus Poriferisocius sp. TaxID=3101276 RepID=UPI003B01B2B0